MYKNFSYNGKRENETKLFVFCAIDNMGHTVYRQLRLLGMKTPPTLAVYDISNKDVTLPPSLPIINGAGFDPDGKFTPIYASALKTYNEKTDVYNALKAVSMSGNSLILTDNDKTIPFQTYTLGTVLKYWVMAERSGDLAIENITMDDVTFSEQTYQMGSDFSAEGQTERAISFVEVFPDVTSRVFLFKATDTLGNTAEIQRTIAITNVLFFAI